MSKIKYIAVIAVVSSPLAGEGRVRGCLSSWIFFMRLLCDKGVLE